MVVFYFLYFYFSQTSLTLHSPLSTIQLSMMLLTLFIASTAFLAFFMMLLFVDLQLRIFSKAFITHLTLEKFGKAVMGNSRIMIESAIEADCFVLSGMILLMDFVFEVMPICLESVDSFGDRVPEINELSLGNNKIFVDSGHGFIRVSPKHYR